MSQQVREIFAEYTPLIEPLSLDEAYLDVTEKLKGMEIATEIALEIRAKIKQVTGPNASAGISYNKFLAKMYGIARGIDERQVRPDRIPKSVGAEDTFVEDIDDLERATAELKTLSEKVWRSCEAQGKLAEYEIALGVFK